MQLDNIHSERDKANKPQTNQLQSINGQKKQIQGSRGRFTSSVHCARTLVSSHGLHILYTGHAINTVREAAFVGAYFFFYEGYKEEFRRSLLGMEKLLASGSGEIDNSSFSTSVAIIVRRLCWGNIMVCDVSSGLRTRRCARATNIIITIERATAKARSVGDFETFARDKGIYWIVRWCQTQYCACFFSFWEQIFSIRRCSMALPTRRSDL